MAIAKTGGLLGLAALTVADTATNGVNGLLPLLISGGLVGGVVALLTTRSKNRESHATADAHLAEAAGDWQTVYRNTIEDQQTAIRELEQRVDEVTRELSGLRDELRDERVERARTETELAQARLAYTELDAKAGHERHDLRSNLAALAVENANLKTEIAELRDQVTTLEARTGITERRQAENRRTTDQ